MTTLTGTIHCPKCGQALTVTAEATTIHLEHDALRAQTTDATARHRCK